MSWGNQTVFFYQRNSDTLLFAIEVKTERTLSVDDLVDAYNGDIAHHSEDLSAENNNINPLHQLFGYLSHNSLKYGVLTTYAKTWFLKRDCSKLYVSPTFSFNNTDPTVFQSYAYIINLACSNHFDVPAPQSPEPETDEDSSSQSSCGCIGNNILSKTINLDHFLRRSFLGCGWTGTVFRAELDNEEVAIKIVDLSQHPEYEDEILTEVVTYDTLKELQGNCIPKLKVAGFDGMLFVIAMELVGSPLEVERTNHEERLTIVDKLSLIHSFGILHGDVRIDNILINYDSYGFKVYFIDFAASKRTSKKSDFAKEMKQLKALLELLVSISTNF